MILYVRYADDFIVGVAGPRSLAVDIQRRIDSFLKSDLHLEVNENRILSRTAGGVNFLGFRIYLSDRSKKTRVKCKHFASMAKYKNRTEARFRASDRRLAQAFVEGAKRDLVKTYKDTLGKISQPLNKASVGFASKDIAQQTIVLGTEQSGLRTVVRDFRPTLQARDGSCSEILPQNGPNAPYL